MKVTRQLLGHRTLLEPDLLAVAAALEPDSVLKSEKHRVEVELSGTHTRGHTTVDWLDRSGKDPNVDVIMEMDKDRLWEMLQAAVR